MSIFKEQPDVTNMGQTLWPAFYDVTKGQLRVFSEKWSGAEVVEDERLSDTKQRCEFSKYSRRNRGPLRSRHSSVIKLWGEESIFKSEQSEWTGSFCSFAPSVVIFPVELHRNQSPSTSTRSRRQWLRMCSAAGSQDTLFFLRGVTSLPCSCSRWWNGCRETKPYLHSHGISFLTYKYLQTLSGFFCLHQYKTWLFFFFTCRRFVL